MAVLRLTKHQELKRAVETGDWTRYDKIRHWSPGGYRKRHAHLRRARRMAEKKLHLLGRFISGEQMHGAESGDANLYVAECPRCKRWAAVDFDDVVRIYGPALEAACD